MSFPTLNTLQYRGDQIVSLHHLPALVGETESMAALMLKRQARLMVWDRARSCCGGDTLLLTLYGVKCHCDFIWCIFINCRHYTTAVAAITTFLFYTYLVGSNFSKFLDLSTINWLHYWMPPRLTLPVAGQWNAYQLNSVIDEVINLAPSLTMLALC